jgi:hypothetical protein
MIKQTMVDGEIKGSAMFEARKKNPNSLMIYQIIASRDKVNVTMNFFNYFLQILGLEFNLTKHYDLLA